MPRYVGWFSPQALAMSPLPRWPVVVLKGDRGLLGSDRRGSYLLALDAGLHHAFARAPRIAAADRRLVDVERVRADARHQLADHPGARAIRVLVSLERRLRWKVNRIDVRRSAVAAQPRREHKLEALARTTALGFLR